MHKDMLGGLLVCGDVLTSTALPSFVHFPLHTVHGAAGTDCELSPMWAMSLVGVSAVRQGWVPLSCLTP